MSNQENASATLEEKKEAPAEQPPQPQEKKVEEKPFNSEDYLVKPHRKKSREVQESDVERILTDAKIMLRICRLPVGVKEGGLALAHAQIDDKDPLRFFILREGAIVINPVLMRHTSYPVPKPEGCLSYPWERKDALVGRFHKITIEYQTLTKDKKLSEKMTMNLKGLAAEIAQHEIDHMNAIYIYDNQ